MQNLNISNQPVSAELLSLAQSDPKWSKIRHVSAGGGYHNSGNNSNSNSSGKGKWSNNSNGNNVNRGGLGFGESGVSQGRSSVAVTSSMLAQGITKTSVPQGYNTASSNNKDGHSGAYVSALPAGMKGFQRAQQDYSSVSTAYPTTGLFNTNTVSNHHSAPASSTMNSNNFNSYTTAPSAVAPAVANNDFAANPYLAGHSQGRGKHLTQPSWMNDNNTAGTTGLTIDNSNNSRINTATTVSTSGQFADTHSVSHTDTSIVKRKSRFESADSNTTQPSAPPTIGASVMLPGFVRPAGAPPVQEGTFSDVSAGNNAGCGVSAGESVVKAPEVEAPRPVKRSRWDA